MAFWDDFHPRVMPYVIGCPVPAVDAALIDAAREFCAKAHCWKLDVTVDTSAGVAAGTFTLPTGAEIIKVERLLVNGKDYKIKTVADLPEDWATNPPDDCTLYHDSQTSYLIFPAPTTLDVAAMTIAMQPTYAAAGIDDEIHALYAEVIAAGARAKLQRMPRQPWTDINQAAIDGAYFVEKTHHAANRNFMRAKDHRVKTWG